MLVNFTKFLPTLLSRGSKQVLSAMRRCLLVYIHIYIYVCVISLSHASNHCVLLSRQCVARVAANLLAFSVLCVSGRVFGSFAFSFFASVCIFTLAHCLFWSLYKLIAHWNWWNVCVYTIKLYTSYISFLTTLCRVSFVSILCSVSNEFRKFPVWLTYFLFDRRLKRVV